MQKKIKEKKRLYSFHPWSMSQQEPISSKIKPNSTQLATKAFLKAKLAYVLCQEVKEQG